MTLHFPNRSRSYDARNKRVRFWGHDSAMEVAFYLEETAIFQLAPETASEEEEILTAFDANWSRIMKTADRAYEGTHQYSHVLAAKDFAD
jgi:hypothetical protein